VATDNTRDNEHYMALFTKVAGTEKVSIEEWVEKAGTIIYLASTTRAAERDPQDVQKALDQLVAIMPNDLLLVSALFAKELVEGV
jgi:hypothetical protein